VLFERNALQTAIKNYENLAEAGASVFFTYLHRLHHYATTRNPEAHELKRPFGSSVRPASRRLRFLRKVARRPFLVAIDDPLTTMQFRALDWILAHEAQLAQKRHDVQRRRKRSDREIFERFPLHYVATYPGDDALLQSALFRLLKPALPSVEKKLDEMMKP